MKALVLLFTTLIAFNVQAQLTDSGLECTMSYKVSGPISAPSSVYTKTSWLAAGQNIMEGDAVIFDHDGEYSSARTAHYVEAFGLAKQGTVMWEVSVYNSEKSLVSSFVFAKESGMKVSIPVRAFATDDEDPVEFDTLEVSCHFTHFFG